MTDMSPKPRPGPGPKPAGPTHPTPTHPPRGNGHALPSYPLPSLADVVSDARIKLTQTIETLGHQRDMTSYPVEGDGPWEMTPGTGDRLLGNVVANVRVALEELEYLASELPPVSSASPIPPVHEPGPPLPDAFDEGDGPPSHRATTGDGRPGGPPSPGAGDSFSLPGAKPFEIHGSDWLMASNDELREWIRASIAAGRSTPK